MFRLPRKYTPIYMNSTPIESINMFMVIRSMNGLGDGSILKAAKDILKEMVIEHGPDRAVEILDRVHREHRDY
jgi:hypothetical protein